MTPTAEGAVTVRFWAAAREAAGTAEEQHPPQQLRELVAAVSARSPRLAAVLSASSLLVDGCRRDPADALALAGGTVVEVLPPFAGG